jgi:hypothetical protein
VDSFGPILNLPDWLSSDRASPVTPNPPAPPPSVEHYAVGRTGLLAGLRAGPSLLTSLIAHEVLGPPLALRPGGESPRGIW